MSIINLVLRPISKKFLLNFLLKAETKYNKSKTENVLNLEGAYNYKEFLPLDSAVQKQLVLFEGYEFAIPSEPEIYLTNLYGDYMKLPPAGKRTNRHGIIKIDFGRCNIKNERVSELKK